MARRKKKNGGERVVKSRLDLMSDGIKRPTITVKKQDVLLALDRSSSMEGAPLLAAERSAKSLIAELAHPRESDAFRVGFLTYNDKASYDVRFTKAADIRLPSVKAEGGTNFTAAITTAIHAFRSSPTSGSCAKPALVFLTDGMHQHGPDPRSLIGELHETADVVAIALGDGPDMNLLRALASAPEFLTKATDGKQLRAFFVAVAKSLTASRASGGLVSAGADPFASRRI